MPEEHFEDKASRLASAFSLEPRPEVWLRVEKKINAEKRKKRAFFFWWLFPLLVAGGATRLLFLTNHKLSDRKERKRYITVIQPKDVSPGQVPGRIDLPEPVKGKKPVRRVSTAFSSVPERIQQLDLPVISELHNPGNAQQEEILLPGGTSAFTNDAIHFSSPGMVSDHTPPGDTGHLSIPSLTELPADSLPVASHPAIDSSRKKKDRSRVNLGLFIETGISFRSGNNPMLSVLPNQDDLSTSPVIGRGLTAVSTDSRKGLQLALGVSLQKSISENVFIDLRAGYRFQQLGFRYLLQDSSAFSGLSVLYQKTEISNYYFLNLYTGAGYRLWDRNRMSLSIQTGVDNACLIAIKQQQTVTETGRFIAAQPATLRYYNRWQPGLSLSLPFRIQTGESSSLQVSPFYRLGLRSVPKTPGNGYSVSSAGVQATYYFK